MSNTTKRVQGGYTIELVDGSDAITLDATNTVIQGDLTVTGNAVLTGNINADRIFNGTSNIEIVTPGANITMSVAGTNDVVDIGAAGMVVSGVAFVTGNVTGANLNTAGLASVTGNITGGNLRTSGNILISRDASAGQPTIRFEDTDISADPGQILGAIEWYTNDATPGARVTSAIRSNVSSVNGNATVEILTSTNGAAPTVKVSILENGNVGISNAAPGHKFSVTGDAYISTTATVIGNITGGNLITAGVVTATGNVTGGNINTAGLASVTGNVIANNINASQQVTAGALGVSATGNIDGGNLISQGIISASGNLTTTDIFGTTVSVSGNITGGNLTTAGTTATGPLTATTATISTSLTGNGVGVTNYVYQGTDATLSSATPVDIGVLTFTAAANHPYRFESYIVLEPDGAMTVAPAVSFAAGSCFYTTETQDTSTGAFAIATKNSSDDVTTTYGMTGTDARTLRITGWFYHTVDTAVTMRFQNSTGNITAKTGSHLAYTRLA
jgi:hypothetical protein